MPDPRCEALRPLFDPGIRLSDGHLEHCLHAMDSVVNGSPVYSVNGLRI